MNTDPISDYLTRIRNAVMANHRMVEVPTSNIKKEITKILFEKGYILNYKFEDDKKPGNIKIALKSMPDALFKSFDTASEEGNIVAPE